VGKKVKDSEQFRGWNQTRAADVQSRIKKGGRDGESGVITSRCELEGEKNERKRSFKEGASQLKNELFS